jgi:multidrug efflux pump subunit AcrB
MKEYSHNIITIFMRHPLAANLLMALMVISGVYGLLKMNVQFLPSYDLNLVQIRVVWPGASADDVEKSILYPIEKELRDVDNIKDIKSTASLSAAEITIRFEDGIDMSLASEEVRDAVSRVRDFPVNSERPIIKRLEPLERIAYLIIYGPKHIDELRYIAWQSQQELQDKGISKINVIGLPKQQISIELNPVTLNNLGLSFNDIADAIALESQDIPSGQIGKSKNAQNLRAVEKKRSVQDFNNLRVLGNQSGGGIILSDIAQIKKTYSTEEPIIIYQGKPAVILQLYRKNQDSALNMAKIAQDWINNKQQLLGKSVNLVLFQQNWLLIKDRIDTLLSNGLSGLILIVILLFLFLDRSTALWVSVGIPISLSAALYVLYLNGGSINMVSLFAFILTLGIIVDDTIVVAEQALTNYQKHHRPDFAIISACYKMMPPIIASALTTISAFIPLMTVSGIIGTILFDIPLIVVCVIVASLVECFLVLPGHLYHSFLKIQHLNKNRYLIRSKIDKTYYYFRYRIFLPIIRKALINHVWVVAAASSLVILVLSLLISGSLKFTFFPTPESNTIKANIQFISGTSKEKQMHFLQSIVNEAYEIGIEMDKTYQLKNSVELAYYILNRTDEDEYRFRLGPDYGSVLIELIENDQRGFTNQEVIEKLRNRLQVTDIISNLAISSPRGGPPGKDIEIQVNGSTIANIKQALNEIELYLRNTPGVTGISDNLPYAQEQLIFKINETGKALGLTTNNVGRQLRAAFQGEILQTFNDPNEEIEVMVRLDKHLRYNRATLNHLLIKTTSGKLIPLQDILTIRYQSLPEIIVHNDHKLSANIEADVDADQANANEILEQIQHSLLKNLENKYNVTFSFKGKAEDQAITLYDIKVGIFTSLLLIYIILAWVFGSYFVPFVVLTAIPLGLIGALLGHWFMGLDITLLSLFGLFGLSGIIINDSIILINEYQTLKQEGMRIIYAITEASSRRLRAILLTSVTTIAGLTPLLFERSIQAQFLIPMACSIVFGLAFGTFLLLFVVPVLTMYFENTVAKIKKWGRK